LFRIAALIVLASFLLSCDAFNKKEKSKTKLARVGTDYLYLEDIKNKLPESETKEDSAEFLNFIIQNWIKDQVVVAKSQELLTNELNDIEEKVANYRKSLLVHAYEQAYVLQNLDTIISAEEISAYYEENADNFQLKDYIVKALYFKIKTDDKISKKANEWFKLKDYENDLDELYKKVAVKSDLFYYDTTNWVYFKDIISVVPINQKNSAEFLRNNRTYKIAEGDYTFYLNILDYKLKDAVSPLSMEEKRIRNIILNKRMDAIRKQLRIDLYENAKKSGQIETYKN
jgi:hypothetical protein